MITRKTNLISVKARVFDFMGDGKTRGASEVAKVLAKEGYAPGTVGTTFPVMRNEGFFICEGAGSSTNPYRYTLKNNSTRPEDGTYKRINRRTKAQIEAQDKEAKRVIREQKKIEKMIAKGNAPELQTLPRKIKAEPTAHSAVDVKLLIGGIPVEIAQAREIWEQLNQVFGPK